MKILMTDFDATFFLGHKYTDELRALVAEWHKAGNIIAISTARSPGRMHETAVEEDLDLDYYICDHSAVIYDKNWNVVSYNVPPKAELVELFRRLADLGVSHMAMADGVKEYAIRPKGNYLERETPVSVEDIDSLVCCPVSIHAVLEDAETCGRLCAEINGDKKSDIFASYWGGKGAFFFKKGNDKCTGGYKLLRLVGGRKEDLYTIGDGSSDAPMIAEFNGYAMANGHSEAKAVARKIYENVGDLMRDILDGKE